jgi:SAM-dependent methyltransferase
MPQPDTKQAEKDYLARTGSSTWETLKPFSPPGLDTLGDSASLLHDFATALLTLRPGPDALILDLGAGGGWCSDLLGRLNRASVAVDISFDMLRAARERPGTAIRAAVGDMEALPFRSGTFQQALCFSALHHVPHMDAAVREIARVLDDDGIAFFSEPGKGHAEAAVSTAAMRDYGVLEQDVVIEQFMQDCLAAGFSDVRVKPLANSIPHFDLTLEQWTAWARLAASTRPRRAWEKIALGAAEIFGLGKRRALFEDTYAITLVRTLRPVVEKHPIVVASKRPLLPPTEQPPWRAELTLTPASGTDGTIASGTDGTIELVVRAVNRGAATWPAISSSGIGQVSVGVQLVDADAKLVSRDYHREPLPHDVAPGQTVTVTCRCAPPPGAGRRGLKVDLVAEGVTWFEAAGTTAPVLMLNDH